MGKYNNQEPIRWISVSETDEFIILLSICAVSAKPFENEKRISSWNECSLNAWLHQSFLQSVFSLSEQSRLMEIAIPTIEQILTWLPIRTDRKCLASVPALADNIAVFSASGDCCTYWLQDTGRRPGMSATIVLPNGGIYQSAYMGATNVGVRPYIKLSK